MSVNTINISLQSKEIPVINISIGEDLEGTISTTVDQQPLLTFITTGPQGPQGANAVVDDGSITNAKLAGGAVTSAKISSSSVLTSKIANSAVTTAKIADDAITSNKIAADAINGSHILAGTVSRELLEDLTLTGDKLENGIITTIKLSDNAITTAKILDGNITAVKIADRNITGAKIEENADLDGEVKCHKIKIKGLSPGVITGPDSDALHIKSNSTIDFLNTSGTTVASIDQNGNLTLSGTVDGVDISTLENLYPTADATKVGYITITQAVDLDTLETNVATNNLKLSYPTADSTKVGFISVSGAVNLDQMDAKLSGIETSADVTDATNVEAAGALMDSELTDLAGVKGVTISTLQVKPSEGAFADGDKTKLDGIAAGATANTGDATLAGTQTFTGAKTFNDITALHEESDDSGHIRFKESADNGSSSVILKAPAALATDREVILPSSAGTIALTSDIPTGVENNADVTDAANVEAAGALMDSEVTNLAEVKAFSSSDYATAAQGTKADTAHGWGNHSSAGYSTATGVEDNADVTDSTNVEAAGALMDSEVTNLAEVKAFSSSDYATAAQGTKADSAQQPPSEGAFADGDKTKLDAIEASADVTDTTNVTAAGALMDSELTDLAGIKSLDTSTLVTTTGNQQISGKKRLTIREFAVTSSSTHADAIGDVIYIGTGATQAGKIYYYASGGGWTAAQADAAATGTGLLAVALGTDPDVDGMLLRGTVTLGLEIGGTEALGSILYLDDAVAGGVTTAAPSSTNDIVRVVGYSLSTDDDMIWFNPDGAWVEHA